MNNNPLLLLGIGASLVGVLYILFFHLPKELAKRVSLAHLKVVKMDPSSIWLVRINQKPKSASQLIPTSSSKTFKRASEFSTLEQGVQRGKVFIDHPPQRLDTKTQTLVDQEVPRLLAGNCPTWVLEYRPSPQFLNQLVSKPKQDDKYTAIDHPPVPRDNPVAPAPAPVPTAPTPPPAEHLGPTLLLTSLEPDRPSTGTLHEHGGTLHMGAQVVQPEGEGAKFVVLPPGSGPRKPSGDKP